MNSQPSFCSARLSFVLGSFGCSLSGRLFGVLGDPGVTSLNDAIFSGESLLQELKSNWELILTEPGPEVVEFRPADWAKKKANQR